MPTDQKCNPDVKTGKFKCGIWDWDRNTHVVQNSTVCGNCSRQWEAFGWVRIIRCDTAAHAASPFLVAAVWTADCRLQTQTCFGWAIRKPETGRTQATGATASRGRRPRPLPNATARCAQPATKPDASAHRRNRRRTSAATGTPLTRSSAWVRLALETATAARGAWLANL